MPRAQLSMTPADILKYQNDLVRTGQYERLGRMVKISIAPADGWNPPPRGLDPFIDKYGRLIDLRDRFLPIGQSLDRSMLLATAPLMGRDNRVSLPDGPDPDWTPAGYSGEELANQSQGQEITVAIAEREIAAAEKAGDLRAAARWRAAAENARAGHQVRMPIERAVEKDMARMIPQRLEDRTVKKLEGTNFMVFQPLINVAFQPEIAGRLEGTAWTIKFGFNPADQTHPALLVDQRTGETHFFGGIYDIFGPSGE
jgi:hypothetical protein